MKSRSQQFLDAIEAGDPSLLPSPITREERFLRALSTGEEITPTTYDEQFMQAARAFKGGGGSVSFPNLFDGTYIVGYFTSQGTPTIYTDSTGMVHCAAIPVTGGNFYSLKKSTSNRFRTLFTSKAPSFDGTEENIGIGTAMDFGESTHAVLQAPMNATHLFFFVSNTGEKPEMKVIDITDI